ncbi:MAG: SUMF1/EgtB/PvdO family nonheme iron enzyme [Bacteroidota bacterium]
MAGNKKRDIIEGIPAKFKPSQKRTNHLLGIGIDEYLHVSKLNNAVRDVEAFAQLMEKEYSFQQKNIHLLKNEYASRKNIIKVLKGITQTFTEKDNLILYFSGHGKKDVITEEGFWIPVEGEKEEEDSWLANETVMRYIRSMKAHHIFLLIDACFAGSFFVKARATGSQYDQATSRYAITSGAEEIVSDGPEGLNSPFAQAVLQHLNEERAAAIGAEGLYQAIKKKISSAQMPQARHLEIYGKLHKGEFCFYRKEDSSAKEKKSEPVPRKVNPTPKDPEAPPFLRSLGLEMMKVEGGNFMMGGYGNYDGKPIHQVSLEDFHIGKYPVTQAQWEKVMGENPSRFTGDLQRPVEQVSWEECQKFIEKLNQQTGMKFRLPSEAEWEYAARGGKLSKGYTYAGSNQLEEVGWFWENSGDKKLSGKWALDKVIRNNGKAHPVGRKDPNELGLYDMSGNIWEWCKDDWHSDYKKAPNNGSAWIDQPRGQYRVARGGSWDYGVGYCRVAFRLAYLPAYRGSYFQVLGPLGPYPLPF